MSVKKNSEKKPSVKKSVQKCPCCATKNHGLVEISTEWGLEPFFECDDCGVIFRPKGA